MEDRDTKVVKLVNGDLIEVRVMYPARAQEASRNLTRKGYNLRGGTTPDEDIEFNAELARIVCVTWRKADGSEPLAGLDPKAWRTAVNLTPFKLAGLIVAESQKFANEMAEGYEVDAGN